MIRKPRLPKEASGYDSTKILNKKLIILKKIEQILNNRIETEEGSESNIDDMRDELEYVINQIAFIKDNLNMRTH